MFVYFLEQVKVMAERIKQLQKEKGEEEEKRKKIEEDFKNLKEFAKSNK